jgi:hypothetical protein
VPDVRQDGGAEQLRRDIAREREELVSAVDTLRENATTSRLTAALEHRLPLVLAGGFLVSGGVGAAVRLALRRGRDSRQLIRVGRFAVVER